MRILALALACCAHARAAAPQPRVDERVQLRAAPQPHIVIVLIDDYGHNNIGYNARTQANAAEVQTPVLDALAAEGVILERHYVFAFCSPSRSALHTGRNPIHVNVLNSDLASVNTADPVSGFAGIPRNMTALPAKLAAVGYETVQAGKWCVAPRRARRRRADALCRPRPALHNPAGTLGSRRPTTRRKAAATQSL